MVRKSVLPEGAKGFSDRDKERLEIIFRHLKKFGRVQHRDAVSLLNTTWEWARGFLSRMVGNGLLAEVFDMGNDCLWYYAAQEGFYSPKKLVNILPSSEVNRIVNEIPDEGSVSLEDIAEQLYGGKRHKPLSIIKTVLDRFVREELIEVSTNKSGDSTYSRTEKGKEFGVDSQTLITLDATALENAIASRAETSPPDSERLTLSALERALAEDLKEKKISSLDISPLLRGKDSWKMLCLAEILFGNQFTDMKLLNWVLGKASPDITLVSGLIQGGFTGLQVDKRRVLADKLGLSKPGHQLVAAGNLLSELEKITKEKVFAFLGDDDEAVADDYAKLAQLAERKNWHHGVNTLSLSAEQKRRLMIREFYAKRRIQREIILPYQYRIGRCVLNSHEVREAIGVRKNEYRLIIEILVAKRRKLEYPKEYEKVVNVAALETVYTEAKRYVTPDSLSLKFGEREILAVHNTNFSPITQYVDPVFAMESQIRQRLAAGHEVPFMTMDFQQEMFYGGYIGDIPNSGGHFFMTLPGMQDSRQESEYRMKSYNRGVLTSKSHRQNTFRKKLAIPGAPEFEFLADGRIRLHIWNNRTREVVAEQRNKPEVREVVALVTDAQHGSITMCPEIEIKYMDYALFERKAKYLFENGDILHGLNYPQTFAENRPVRLTSVNSQKAFTELLQLPLIQSAPALEVFGAWLGNHEWNTFGRNISGTNDLEFLISALRGFVDGQVAAGKTPVLKEVFNVSRIRWAKTHNPTNGDMVNWPYYARTIAGFKLAISHLWMMRGGGRTPIDKQRKWLTGMAQAASDIDYMFGGHYHSLWWCQEANKLLLQLPSTASQSGYELVLGMMSTAMCTLIEVSNRDGVTLEFIPWEFLLNIYKCQSPAYKGRDADLMRPLPGTGEYSHGKMSPLIEQMIDDCTLYTPV